MDRYTDAPAGTWALLAVSLDGRIADATGGVGWLEDLGDVDTGLEQFMARVGAIVVGRATYEQVLGFGWPYGATPTWLVTSRVDDVTVPDGAEVHTAGDVAGAVAAARGAAGDGIAWLLGGGMLVAAALEAGLVDVLEVAVVPVVLGQGPLLVPPTALADPAWWRLVDHEVHDADLVRLRYVRR